MKLTLLELNILMDALYGSMRISDANCLFFQFPEQTRKELWSVLQGRLNCIWLETENFTDEIKPKIDSEEQKET